MNSKIGGQAVIEGVMMRNGSDYAVAVRTPDGEIVTKKEHIKKERTGILKAPVIRGVVAFIDSLVIGIKTLTYSASFFEEDETGSKQKQEDPKNEKLMLGGTVALSVVLGVAIFMLLPWFISNLIGKHLNNTYLTAVIEGLLRLLIFIGYIVAISQMNDIKRVFMYHGAEHKSINCIENGLDLNVANVRKQSRCHKRCGTSFMFFVIFISIIVFMFIRVENHLLQMGLRLLLVPVIAGISYEIIRFLGSSENKFVVAISKPGFMFQNLTTREPDDDMIEVAIASVEAVFDWEKFVEKVRKDKTSVKAETEKKAAAKAETEKKAAAKAEAEKKATAKAEAEKKAAAKAEAERKAAAKAEAERKAAAKAEAEKKAAAKAEAERQAAKKAEAERLAAEEAEALETERLAAARAKEERIAEEKAKAEKAARLEAERIAEEKAKAEEAARREAEQIAKEAAKADELLKEERKEETSGASTSARVRKEGFLSSLDTVLFVKKEERPAKEFVDPLLQKHIKRTEQPAPSVSDDDDDDDVLKALDKFFVVKDKNE
jgi:uncharacterized protein YqhQ